jgi:anti-anti-sigma factor
VAHICPEFDGYIHIRSAIQALMAAADDLEAKAGETGRDSIGALDRIHEALAGLHKETYQSLLDRYKQLIDIYQEDTMQAAVITNYRQPLETWDRPELCLTISGTSTKTIVHCTGKITSNTAQSLRTTVKPLFSDSSTVELDLTNVSYMDSSALGTIVRLCASAKAGNCQLKLINLNYFLKETLSIARLNEVLVDPAFWRPQISSNAEGHDVCR